MSADRARRIRILSILVLVAWAAAGASAFPRQASSPKSRHAIDLWLDQCMEKDQSTRGMLDCLGQAYVKWDTELNRVYKDLMARLSPENGAALRSAQLAWINQRDEEFKFLESFYLKMEGSMYRTMFAADRVDMVRKRTLALQSYLDVLTLR